MIGSACKSMPISSKASSCLESVGDKPKKIPSNDALQMELAGKDATSSLKSFFNYYIAEDRTFSHDFPTEVLNSQCHAVANQGRLTPNLAFECDKFTYDWRCKYIRKNDLETCKLKSSFNTVIFGAHVLQMFPTIGQQHIRIDSTPYDSQFRADRGGKSVTSSYQSRQDSIAESALFLLHSLVDNLSELMIDNVAELKTGSKVLNELFDESCKKCCMQKRETLRTSAQVSLDILWSVRLLDAC